MSEAIWFVRSGDQEFGPLSLAEFQTLTTNGTFGPLCFGSTDQKTWRLIKDIQLDVIDLAALDAASTVEPNRPNEQWHLHAHDGKRFGPVPKSELLGWVVDGSVTADCLVWREGTPNWQRAGTVFPNLPSVPVQVSQVSIAPALVQPKSPSNRKNDAEPPGPVEAAMIALAGLVGLVLLVFAITAIDGWGRKVFGVSGTVLLLLVGRGIYALSRR
jgi:hypothetical protein